MWREDLECDKHFRDLGVSQILLSVWIMGPHAAVQILYVQVKPNGQNTVK